jgi:hypothetical protein
MGHRLRTRPVDELGAIFALVLAFDRDMDLQKTICPKFPDSHLHRVGISVIFTLSEAV